MAARSRTGQSLVELLVGIALTAVFVIGAAGAVAPSLQVGQQAGTVGTEVQLEEELANNVRAWSAQTWPTVLQAATGTSSSYYLNIASSPFALVSATTTGGIPPTGYSGSTTESINLQGARYYRSFSLFDVYRDASGNATSNPINNYYDPSTKFVTITAGVASSTIPAQTYSFYIARSTSNAFDQTNWLGGSGQTGVVTVASSTYASSSNIGVNATGSIQLSVVSVNVCTL